VTVVLGMVVLGLWLIWLAIRAGRRHKRVEQAASL
jgi:hypothetical protein